MNLKSNLSVCSDVVKRKMDWEMGKSSRVLPLKALMFNLTHANVEAKRAW